MRRLLIATAVALLAAASAGAETDAADSSGAEARTPTPTTQVRTQRDDDVANAVGRALADDRRVHAMNMKVAVLHGVVTLTGRAQDADEQRAAEEVARRVPGVRDVENRLAVAEPGAPEPGTSMIPEVPSPAKR